MKYFKNAELARLYNVSEKSVRNWVEAAKSGRIDLTLFQENNKTYIADTLPNEVLLHSFTQRAKKYRNSSSLRKLYPRPELYEIYNNEQILDMINNLEVHSEMPQDYRYIGPGAVDWSTYLHMLHASKIASGNMLQGTIKTLQTNKQFIYELIEPYENVNVIDIGVGNGLAVKNLMQDLLPTGKLRKYIGIDNSPQLLSITENNFKNWFGDAVPFEAHIKDIRHDNLRGIVASQPTVWDAKSTINIFLLLGGTINNFRDPGQAISTISSSMGESDVLFTTMKADTKLSRRFFDFNARPTNHLLPLHDTVALELLGFDTSLYEVEQEYDSALKARIAKITLNTAVALHFSVNMAQRIITLEKGTKILLWRINHYSIEELVSLYREQGMQLLLATATSDQEVILHVSRLTKTTY